MESAQSFSLFSYKAYALWWFSRLTFTLGTLAQSVTLGWQVYALARQSYDIQQSSFLVGMIGLAQFLPLFAFTLIAGETADRYDRRRIMMICAVVIATCSLGFLTITLSAKPSLVLIFILAAVFGAARSFSTPASTALVPMLVPREILPRAIAWNSLSVEAGMILGPWLGGILSTVSPAASYAVNCLIFLVGGLLIFYIKGNTKPVHTGGRRLDLIREGLIYVWQNKLVFGAISLDLFAVLLGGVTALLPVFARDILHIGPDGFGLLRSGPALGGGLSALWLSRHPLQKRAGITMLSAVALFGGATIIFGVSKYVWLSMAALIVLGAADVISVFVRQTLVQIVTPDAMRGRVAAVSTLFISASNELGEFESGVTARLLGPVGSAVVGGIGSILVVILWAKLFPDLRKADRLNPAE